MWFVWILKLFLEDKWFENNPEISHMTEISKHTAYVFSFIVKLLTIKLKTNNFFNWGPDYMIQHWEVVINIFQKLVKIEHKNVTSVSSII